MNQEIHHHMLVSQLPGKRDVAYIQQWQVSNRIVYFFAYATRPDATEETIAIFKVKLKAKA